VYLIGWNETLNRHDCKGTRVGKRELGLWIVRSVQKHSMRTS